MSFQSSQHLQDVGAVQRPLTAGQPRVRLAGSLFGLMGVWILASGCGGGPPALKPPDLNPSAAADAAMELYDKNGDGILDSEELEACPALAKAAGVRRSEGGVVSWRSWRRKRD